MRCPFCGAADSRVIDSRSADDGNTIRRRRECTACSRRFTTYEVVEKVPLMVIKNDGRREPFSQQKLLNGLIRSCEKRDIPTEKIVKLAQENFNLAVEKLHVMKSTDGETADKLLAGTKKILETLIGRCGSWRLMMRRWSGR